MKLVLLVIAGLIVLAALHYLATWAEDRGWIYYRKRRGFSGAIASAVLETQAILEPSKRYVIEEKTRERTEDQDSGDPPET